MNIIGNQSFQGTELMVGQKRFTKFKFEGLDGKIAISFSLAEGDFIVKASASGLEFRGTYTVETPEEMDRFAWLVGQAQTEVEKLRKAATKKLTGSLTEH